MKKILIAGTFDILHPGHLNLIKQAREYGDFLVAVIARDVNVIKTKGRNPYYNENERVKNLEKLGLVDKVILGNLHDYYKIIKEENPRRIALGYDQHTYVNGLNNIICNSNLSASIEILESFKEDVCKGKNIRSAVEDNKAGFLLINKDKGWTSHDVVAKLRSILNIKSIGHTGTLDPFATGLLICAIGKATKMVGIFDVMTKEYEATVKLGVVSDTYDRTGKIEDLRLKTNISEKQIEEILKSFIGKQKQVPPMFSAKKINGKKLYELARQGKEIERQPAEIEIYGIELLRDEGREMKDVLHPTSFVIRIKCSTGTYIRSLAHDFGQKLGTGAILEELKRTAIGSFRIEDSVSLEQLTKENYSEYLIEPLTALEKINLEYLKPTTS